MRIFSIIIALAIYVFWRAVYPYEKGWGRAFWGMFLLLAAGFPTYISIFGGGISSPTLSLDVMLIGESIFLITLNFALFLLIRDALILVGKVFHRKFLFLESKRLLQVILVCLVPLTLYAEFSALKFPAVKEVEIAFDNLPRSMDGFKIVQLTDLHIANVFNGKRIEKIVEKSNALQPDLILLTGDVVDGTVEGRANDVKALSQLRAIHGVYCAEGNHEHYVDYAGWLKFYSTLGMKVLTNDAVNIGVKDDTFTLLGLTDIVAERFNRELPSIKKALEGKGEHFRIAVVHQPKLAKRIADGKIDLMLSGHTHGGQTPLWSIAVMIFNNGFLRGLYSVKGTRTNYPMTLYISQGTGLWTGFLERLGTHNEITLLTLRKRK